MIHKMRFIFNLAVSIVFFGVATMWLWNSLMPEIFKLPQLSFSQAVGLLVLTRVLFGGFGILKDMGHFMARKERQAIIENWHSLSPEQRAIYLERIRSRHGKFPCSTHDGEQK